MNEIIFEGQKFQINNTGAKLKALPKINTKWGKARFDREYYKVGKKAVHRLIYEDYHNCKLSPQTHIHHLDGNKLNNSIENLVAVTPQEHRKLHKELNKSKNNKNERIYVSRKDYPKIALTSTGKYAYLYAYSTKTGKRDNIGAIYAKDITVLERIVKFIGGEWGEEFFNPISEPELELLEFGILDGSDAIYSIENLEAYR